MSESMYIYALRDPETGKVGYVGGSKNPRKRYGQHLAGNNNKLKTEWIAGLKDLPELEILEETNSERWTDRERFWIEYFHSEGHWLTNVVVPPPASRWTFKCTKCGSTTVPHQGKGLCRNCYMKAYRRKQKTIAKYDDEDLAEAFEKGRVAGAKEVVVYADADIERATWDGVIQAVNVLDAALEEHGGSCSLYDDHIALRLNGQTLRAKLEQ